MAAGIKFAGRKKTSLFKIQRLNDHLLFIYTIHAYALQQIVFMRNATTCLH